jgi:hypothetical protein
MGWMIVIIMPIGYQTKRGILLATNISLRKISNIFLSIVSKGDE